MRPFLTVALIASALAAAAGVRAQTLYDDPGRYNALQMQLEIAQQHALANQLAANAAQARFDTETRLNSLAMQRSLSAGFVDTNVIDRSAILQGAQLDARMSVDAARIAELTDAALARSNARIAAIEPARQ
jgi:uncharacterized LabA/DUF88 family protein